MRKTCKSQTEAREKVWDLNKETENVLETLAVLFERFERANSDLADIDKQFDVRYEEMEELVEGEGPWRLRSWWRSLCEPQVASVVPTVGWQLITATSSVSKRTGDRTDKRTVDLQKSWDLLTNIFNEGDREGFEHGRCVNEVEVGAGVEGRGRRCGFGNIAGELEGHKGFFSA